MMKEEQAGAEEIVTKGAAAFQNANASILNALEVGKGSV